ncbi:hypothetical protein C2U72_07630 [Prosthecomicrobium hirschii]|uniref:hypothetical protein n=1 Tax=Prosthecodimorpha hirschii TaxID=665126 RepID=UPI0011268B6F|nr:hypothetical protein [Prosthecomicrobium hirschii]TPQ51587.1 hypothetical protein C2U72_07630 [Prosthecomicrobium hirschii]
MTQDPIRTVRIRPLADLGDRLGSPHDLALADLAAAIVYAEACRHDERRPSVGAPRSPPEAERPLRFSYFDPTGALAASWGVGPEALAFLGYAHAAGRPDIVMGDIFTMHLGLETVWGNAETGYFLDVSDPWTIYR